MSKKADITFRTSQEVLDRFASLVSELNATNEQALIYLLDLHDGTKLDRGDQPAVKSASTATLHTCVAPEIRNKFRQLAAEHGMSYHQLLAALLDEHEERAGCGASPEAAQAAADSPRPGEGAALPAGTADPLLDRLDNALDAIREVFLEALGRPATDEKERRVLLDRLAAAEADAAKARESRKKLQDALGQLASQLG